MRSRYPRLFGLLSFAILQVACTNAFRVSADRRLKGLPFYMKSVVFRQHSIYEYSWLRVSLSIAPVLETKDGVEKLGASTVISKDIRDNTETRSALKVLRSLVSDIPRSSPKDLPAAIGGVRDAFNVLKPLASNHLNAPSEAELRLAGNFIEQMVVVDYARTYYLNATVPFFGSSNLAAELAADGTLSKGSNDAVGGGSEAVTALASAATGVAPIKELLSAKWLPSKQDSALLATKLMEFPLEVRTIPGPQSLSFRVEVSIEPQSLTFDFFSDSTRRTLGATLVPLTPKFDSAQFTSHVPSKPAEKQKDDGISFSGKVIMPAEKKP